MSIKCKIGLHDWSKNCEKCSKCENTRDFQHDWSKDSEKCSKCGYIRKSVEISTQEWMVKNLDVCTYRNGDTIPQVKDNNEWNELTSGAWCYYDNDAKYGTNYGKLYNWYAVNDPRGLAPIGYHIPTYEEWESLSFWRSHNNACLKYTSGWVENGNGRNLFGFAGLAGGKREASTAEQQFRHLGCFGQWWSTTENEFESNKAGASLLCYSHNNLVLQKCYIKEYGLSVRCVRDL
jgi:uncharacterized protein (TIGR02145 family)